MMTGVIMLNLISRTRTRGGGVAQSRHAKLDGSVIIGDRALHSIRWRTGEGEGRGERIEALIETLIKININRIAELRNGQSTQNSIRLSIKPSSILPVPPHKNCLN